MESGRKKIKKSAARFVCGVVASIIPGEDGGRAEVPCKNYKFRSGGESYNSMVRRS